MPQTRTCPIEVSRSLPTDGWPPHPTCKAEPSHAVKENHLTSCIFSRVLTIITQMLWPLVGGWNVDLLVNREPCLLAQLSIPQWTNSVSAVLHMLLQSNCQSYDSEILGLLLLGRSLLYNDTGQSTLFCLSTMVSNFELLIFISALSTNIMNCCGGIVVPSSEWAMLPCDL